MDREWIKRYIEMSLKTIEKEIKFVRKYLQDLEESDREQEIEE